MKISIIASGSRGDVQPYVALAKGLQRAGHEVKFVSHHDYSELITQHDIEFWDVPGNVQAIAQSPELSKMLAKGKFLAIMKIMGEEAQRASINLAQVALKACQDVALILGGFGGLENGIAIGEKLEIPVIPAYLLPLTPTKSFPSVLTPTLPAWLNKISHRLARQVIWQSLRKADEVARKEVLGISSGHFFGPYGAAPLQNKPTLYAFSKHVIPQPVDWADDKKIVGYWFLGSADDWQPPKHIVDFIGSGSPPVYIGFGSMNNRDPERTAKTIIEAVLKSKQRAILQSGWGGLQARELPDSILMIDSIPHSWLFPQMAAVVHHGGVGTTASGLRAGVPNIIIPFFGDQPFWGRRVAKLGVGPLPIPIKKLSVSALASAIEFSVSNVAISTHARELGRRICEENGVEIAVEIIEHALK